MIDNLPIIIINSVIPSANGPYPVVSSQSIDVFNQITASDGITYNIYAFTNNTSTSKAVSSYTINYTANTSTYCYLLAIGGGGGGGTGTAGGGGAGGLVMMPTFTKYVK